MHVPVTVKSQKRIMLLFIMVVVLMVALCLRLGYWQIIKGEWLKNYGIEQRSSSLDMEAQRGEILDRNGTELAESGTVYTLIADPTLIRNSDGKKSKSENIDYAAGKLAKILDMDRDDVEEKITKKDTRYVRVAKDLTKEQKDKISALKIDGLTFEDYTKRNYPMGSMAAHLLGTTDSEGNGTSGVEKTYNEELSGVDGKWVAKTDKSGSAIAFETSEYYEAQDGSTIYLTIDATIQNYAETALAAGMKSSGADNGLVVIMDPETGEILAMAVLPTYDPNNHRVPAGSEEKAKFNKMSVEEQGEYLSKLWRNPIVSDTYEPGSTFKLVTTSAILEEDLYRDGETFYCSGKYKIADRTIHCWNYPKAHGSQTLEQAVGHSCNPVFVQLSERLGEDNMYKYISAFGFQDKTGIDLPAESYAQVLDPDYAGPVELATMSFGQGIAVTPIQMITAISAIGNDGKVVRPYVVKKIKNSDGEVVSETKTKVVRQAISSDTAGEVLDIMYAAVEEGDVKTAKVKGYKVGAKTGTSQQPDENGGYSDSKYWASYVGLAPIDDPKLAVLVVLDNPKGTGSVSAAPIGAEIMKNALKYMKIPK